MFDRLGLQAFLRGYWQKQPLLLRSALPQAPVLSAKDLQALACNADVESRLVLGNTRQGWNVEYGPFSSRRFARLPPRSWTLLVQDVDKHLPRVAALLDPFRSFPSWRVDDVMVSLAAPGGSVGPHLDNYDVFLIQLQGKRRWQLSRQADDELVADAPLKLLARFSAESEYVVEPGDVLYLPPGVAHYGLATSRCLTASVGFRAPSQQELSIDFLEELSSASDPLLRYTDPDLVARSEPHELRPSELKRLRKLVRAAISVDDASIDDFIGRYLTRLKPNFELQQASDPRAVAAAALLEAGALSWVRRRHASRWLYCASARTPHWFVNGTRVRVPRSAERWMRALASGHPLQLAELPRADAKALTAALLACHALGGGSAAAKPPRANSEARPVKTAGRRSAASRRTR